MRAKEIHESQTLKGNIGEKYDASTPDYQLAIDGYTLDSTQLPDNMTGTFSDTAQTVTYIYTKRSHPSSGCNGGICGQRGQRNTRIANTQKAILGKSMMPARQTIS